MKLFSLLNELEMFHGSRFDLDCFKISKVGSGIGNQGYGHGIYFSLKEATSMWYATLGSVKNPKAADKQRISDEEIHDLELRYENKVFLRLPNNINKIQELIDYAEENIGFLEDEENQTPDIKWWIKEYQEFIKIIKNYRDEDINIKKGYEEGIGYLYKVLYDKGDPNNYNFLYNDKRPTQDQLKMITNYAYNNNQELYHFLTKQITNNTFKTGLDLYHKIVEFFSSEKDDKETFMNKSINGERLASMFLLNAGIDGNNIRNGDEIIIFDPSKVKIINKCRIDIKNNKKL